ncbi:MAG: bifunctional proline dehydrogenase/L-glutamate gamma-semialdehyde dehydrogenase [Lentisphaeraceae bacterium]|nr:bifunctional proline dehydrogenase/L-glutamate gamma-semialdehyde dehydrogenase [Lentisphaeraceae bacterium]
MDLSQAQNIIDQVKTQDFDDSELVELSIQLAKVLIKSANEIQSRDEYNQMEQLNRLMKDPAGKQFTTSMTDECFRSEDNRRIANQIIHLLDVHGTPKYLDTITRWEMSTFKALGERFASYLIPMVKELIRKETSRVILPGESDKLKEHLLHRKSQGITTNLNHLGEAILGEGETEKRLQCYLDDLAKPEIEYISVKISTIFSQINLLAYKETLEVLKERLRILYRSAMKHTILLDGETKYKFVNLDMEEYRDLHLTIDLFKAVLSEDEFLKFNGGIVLQAYLPDSFAALEELTTWSKDRFSKGGACIKIRLVKGANLAMEKVEASLKDWEQTPFQSKLEVDAHYRKLVNFALNPENVEAVNIGIASHNIFDLSYAMLLKFKNEVSDYVNFEMLEGMAEHIRDVVQELSQGIILYCPAAGKEEFQNAIAYLIRRLDENTAEENFLRHLFDLKPSSLAFSQQTEFFKEGCSLVSQIDSTPRRSQNRNEPAVALEADAEFRNEADTDFALLVNQKWGQSIYQKLDELESIRVPLFIDGESISEGDARPISSPNGNVLGEVILASSELVNRCLESSAKAFASWSKTSIDERCKILYKMAHLVRVNRGKLIGIMIQETGKTLIEADVEVSEAIDFCEYYSRSMKKWAANENLSMNPLGTVLVASPWNFPLAIPIGGVASALVTGNTVIFKPAPEASLVGFHIAELFYEAGCSRSVLQFLNCHDESEGSQLIKDERVAACILTGATSTAQLFMKLRPTLNLMAETGGKNCLIVTDMSDRDLAIKDITHSAFGHAGQKCSACSLLILEENVYEDQKFLTSLKDATESLSVGVSTKAKTVVNPLIHEPEEKLARALTTLEDGETWLVEPAVDSENPNLWSPGIKLGVNPESYTFNNEFFGPVLGVVKASDLEGAIDMVNSLNYGLTGGIHSLDDREQELWLSKVQVGNAYINRTITGAIVNRQPFGGIKNSSFGRGLKAGGENYLLQLMSVEEDKSEGLELNTELSDDFKDIYGQISILFPNVYHEWKQAVLSYEDSYKNYFSVFKDHSDVLGQENYTLYKADIPIRLFVQAEDSVLDVLSSIAAAKVCDATLEIFVSESRYEELHLELFLPWEIIEVTITSEESFSEYFYTNSQGRNRFISQLPSEWLEQASKDFCFVKAVPVYAEGRIELLNYLRAMSVSDNYHRYGNLGNKKH